MGKAKSDLKLRLPENIVFTRLDEDDGIILNLDTKNYYSLNGSACFILESLKNGATCDKLTSSLSIHYGINNLTAKKDLEKTLSYLRKEKIIL